MGTEHDGDGGALAEVERGHVVEDACRRLEDRQRQARPGTLTETKIQIEEGSEAYVFEGHSRSGFNRLVTSDAVVENPRAERCCSDERGRGDNAIEDDRHGRSSGADQEPRQTGDLQSTQ